MLWRHFAEVFLQQQSYQIVVQPVVQTEIAQVKEDVTHPGVFPIEQANFANLARYLLIQPVQVEQVIVAGGRGIGILREGFLYLTHNRREPIEIERESAMMTFRDAGQPLHAAEDVELAI